VEKKKKKKKFKQKKKKKKKSYENKLQNSLLISFWLKDS